MKGIYHVIVQNKRLRYEFDIRRNITVIRGDSATGKTTLYSMIALAARRGDSSGVEVQCEKKCRILDELGWKLNVFLQIFWYSTRRERISITARGS